MRLDEALAAIGAVVDQAKARDRDAKRSTHFDMSRVVEGLRARAIAEGRVDPATGRPVDANTRSMLTGSRVSDTGGTVRLAGYAPPPTKGRTKGDLEAYYRGRTMVEVHEAGHALVANILGLPVQMVSVVGGDDGVTSMRYGSIDDVGAEAALAVLVAGWRAERTHPGWIDEFDELWRDQSDRALFEERIAALGVSRADELRVRAHVVERVDELLERYRDRLDELTRVLIRDRAVSGKRLAEILEGR